MKKLLAILLVCVFALSVVACGGDESGTSDTSSTSNPETSTPTTPTTPTTPSDSDDESSAGTSSTDDSSVDSSVTDDPVVEVVETLPQFVSWKNAYYNGGIVGNKPADATSLTLNKINAVVEAGENGLYTFTYGATIKADGQDYAEFAVATFEYDHTVAGYLKKSFADVGTADAETAIPMDGFVLVISKDNTAKIEAIKAVDDKTLFFPHGIVINNGLDAEIKKAATAPVVDGTVSEAEYGTALWEINPDNVLFSYAQFKTAVNATGKAYATWDDTYLYVGIVIDTPDHYVTITADNANQMWDQTCIQMNICSVAPNGEYIGKNYHQDGGSHEPANANIIRQYGLAYNVDSAETLKTMYFGDVSVDNSVCVNSRVGQTTTYEIMIPWSDIGPADSFVSDLVPAGRFVPEVGKQIGISFSVNSGTAEQKFQNITMRDGGGVIGSNDWAKMPTITLAA